MSHVHAVVRQEIARLHDHLSKSAEEVRREERQIKEHQSYLREAKARHETLYQQLAEFENFLQLNPKD